MATVAPSSVAEIHIALVERRRQASRALERAELEAEMLQAGAEALVIQVARARVREIEEVRDAIADGMERINAGYPALIEALAASSKRLMQAAGSADFSPPRWPTDLNTRVDSRLSGPMEDRSTAGKDTPGRPPSG